MYEAFVDCTVPAAELLRLCRYLVLKTSTNVVRGAVAENPLESATDPRYLLAEALVDEKLLGHQSA